MRVNGHIADTRRAELSRIVSDFPTLEHVVRWAFAEGLELAEVIPMDEFTHDVVVPLPDELVLVFDTT
ncbi:MAG: hypothetical protein KTR31_35195 [Myxococcales bacterium]|nr:hypothetical protein [Myxococcales bacterium]